MAYVFGLNDLSDALIKTGKAILGPHSSTNELLTLLDETESLLKKVDQDQPLSMQNVLTFSKNALISSDLLNHPDSDVRVSLVSCLTEMFRITSPNPPYNDDQMKEIFRLTVEAFEKLSDADVSSRSYKKAESVLVLVSKLKSCLIMLDLECDDLILQMFRMFLSIIRYDHPRVVFESMEMIMIIVIDETDEVSRDLLDTLLDCVKKENQTVSPMSWSLAEKVLRRCGCKLKPYIIKALKSTGAILDMYYPVLTTICNTVIDTPKVHNVVETKENEAVGTELVAPNDSSKDKLVLEHSRMETRSKSSSKRPETQSLKQVQSESTDLGVTGKRGRKPNSLMNPEEGYDMPWISGKRDSFKTPSKRNGSGGESSVGKVAAKKTTPAKESSPVTSRALTGSVKRSRFNMDEDHDLNSFSSPRGKKLASCFRDEESLEKESNQESYEDDLKMGNSRRMTRSQNGVEISPRTAKKKPTVEPKIVTSSGRRSSAHSDAKKKNLEAGSPDTPVPQSSKGKKKVSQVAAIPLAEELEETSKRHPARSRAARKEVESDTNGFGQDLVGKRVNIWWPLDNTFYEGVIKSYSRHKKMHRVLYYDGESELLNLVKERWELLEDLSEQDDEHDLEIDLPESIPLSDIMQKQKVKRGKGESKAAETDRREEQEVSRDVDQEIEGEYYNSEMQEQSENKSEESLKLTDTEEAEAKETESEREGSESEEEPKWRETDDMEDEAEHLDDQVPRTSQFEIESDEEN